MQETFGNPYLINSYQLELNEESEEDCPEGLYRSLLFSLYKQSLCFEK